MIHIVHVISGLDLGGAERMLARLVCGMDRTRYSAQVVSLTTEGQLGKELRADGIPVESLGMRRGSVDIGGLLRLILLLRKAKPGLVQSWLYHADLLSLLASRFAGAPPLVWNLRGSNMNLGSHPRQTRWVVRALALCSPLPDAVVVNSLAGQQYHQGYGYRPRKWAFIPNGFDTNLFRPDHSVGVQLRKELGVLEDVVLIGLIARVDPMKDHGTFLAAARQVATARANVHFVLAGKKTETLLHQVTELGLADRVHFIGLHRQINQVFAGVDIVCLTSAFGEGFPNVLGEAMAAGVPCITTDVGDARMIVAQTGIVVPPRDSQAVGRAMLDLIDRGPAVRYKLGQAARVRVENEYSLGQVIFRYEALYESILRGNAG